MLRSFEADSWKDEHFPVYSSDYIASLEKVALSTSESCVSHHRIPEAEAG